MATVGRAGRSHPRRRPALAMLVKAPLAPGRNKENLSAGAAAWPLARTFSYSLSALCSSLRSPRCFFIALFVLGALPPRRPRWGSYWVCMTLRTSQRPRTPLTRELFYLLLLVSGRPPGARARAEREAMITPRLRASPSPLFVIIPFVRFGDRLRKTAPSGLLLAFA